MRTCWALAASLAALALSGCSKGETWVLGQWVLLAEDGKPGACHEFKKDGTFITYTTSDCGGSPDALLSGRWEFKEETQLALKRGNDLRGKLAVIAEKSAERFVSRGAVAGTLFRVGAGGAAEVLRKLDAQGLIKLKPLPSEWGCRQLGMALPAIKALPVEKEPRMLRQKDTALEYHANTASGDPKVEKVVYALQQETIEWIALHLAGEAFTPPGPQERVETAIGKPVDSVATGAGQKRQHIVMWKSYCAQLRDTPNKDIDVTLFATAGQRRGTLYVSENVVANLWEEMKQMVKDPGAQAADEEDEEETPAKADTQKAAPPAKTDTQKAAPAKTDTQKAAPSPTKSGNDDDDI
jgi:hypothetical protein